MIGVFLAILELVRHRHVSAEQDEMHGEIWIQPSDSFSHELDLSDIDPYDARHAERQQEAADEQA
jgi:segregation and condensation protein A